MSSHDESYKFGPGVHRISHSLFTGNAVVAEQVYYIEVIPRAPELSCPDHYVGTVYTDTSVRFVNLTVEPSGTEVTCSYPDGAVFPSGTTMVWCQARGQHTRSDCVFAVHVHMGTHWRVTLCSSICFGCVHTQGVRTYQNRPNTVGLARIVVARYVSCMW